MYILTDEEKLVLLFALGEYQAVLDDHCNSKTTSDAEKAGYRHKAAVAKSLENKLYGQPVTVGEINAGAAMGSAKTEAKAAAARANGAKGGRPRKAELEST